MADNDSMATAYNLIRNITQWHHDRNLLMVQQIKIN